MSKYTATIGTRNTPMLSTTLCLHLGCLSCKTRTTFFVSEMDIKFRIMMSIKTILGCIHAIQKYIVYQVFSVAPIGLLLSDDLSNKKNKLICSS